MRVDLLYFVGIFVDLILHHRLHDGFKMPLDLPIVVFEVLVF
jgi:hypothetical protein